MRDAYRNARERLRQTRGKAHDVASQDRPGTQRQLSFERAPITAVVRWSAQYVQLDTPGRTEYLPIEHVWHWPVMPKVPSPHKHCCAAYAPSSNVLSPAGQAVHAVWPELFAYVS